MQTRTRLALLSFLAACDSGTGTHAGTRAPHRFWRGRDSAFMRGVLARFTRDLTRDDDAARTMRDLVAFGPMRGVSTRVARRAAW